MLVDGEEDYHVEKILAERRIRWGEAIDTSTLSATAAQNLPDMDWFRRLEWAASSS
jgi:hypothetical protein